MNLHHVTNPHDLRPAVPIPKDQDRDRHQVSVPHYRDQDLQHPQRSRNQRTRSLETEEPDPDFIIAIMETEHRETNPHFEIGPYHYQSSFYLFLTKS